MNPKAWTAAALAGLLVLGAARAQDKDRTVKADDFEGELSGWILLKIDASGAPAEDGESKVSVTREAAQVKAGKGSLAYVHEVTPGVVRVLALQRELELSGMASLRLWVKSSAATAVVLSLTERNGASYQCPVTLAAGAWQEIAVNLDEFTADDPAKDDNGRLDPGEVNSLHLFDFGGFLSALIPDLKGTRTIWLDDVTFSSRKLPLTTGPTTVTRPVPVHLVDNFESPVVRWAALSVEFGDALKLNLFDAPVAIDRTAPAEGGKQSLKFTYPRPAAKVHGLLRGVEKVDLSRATALDLSLRTSSDGTYIVNLEERDGSRYNRIVELKAADGWKSFSFGLGDFALADDSQDENGRLDAAEIKQVLVADATALLGGAAGGEVTLWLDEVRFLLAP
jgi:hypothetical protein